MSMYKGFLRRIENFLARLRGEEAAPRQSPPPLEVVVASSGWRADEAAIYWLSGLNGTGPAQRMLLRGIEVHKYPTVRAVELVVREVITSDLTHQSLLIDAPQRMQLEIKSPLGSLRPNEWRAIHNSRVVACDLVSSDGSMVVIYCLRLLCDDITILQPDEEHFQNPWRDRSRATLQER